MRKVINLNRDWRFLREDAGLPEELPARWDKVDLPHTWNAVDGHDGNGGYFRGKCWYAKSFETPVQPLGGGRVYVEILAAGQQATVYVNGTEVTYHEGGYSIFRADICARRRKRIFWWLPAAMRTRAVCILRRRTLPFTADCTEE